MPTLSYPLQRASGLTIQKDQNKYKYSFKEYSLAFPARWISGRPAFAVTQPFLFEYAVMISVAVQHTSVFFAIGCLPSRHVRLSSMGAVFFEGCMRSRIISRGRSCAIWWIQNGIAETREMGNIPQRTWVSIGVKAGITSPGQSTRRTSCVQKRV